MAGENIDPGTDIGGAEDRTVLSHSQPVRPRKIIHVDMDAFYASVEQRDHPELRGKPVAVGGAQARGVVAAASYEARVFGVRSAMPSVTAQRKCPELVFLPPRFDVYRAISQQVRAILSDYTPLVEPLSLDEAYLDVSENRKGIASATWIAKQIRARIRRETGLTASAGVSYNKFLAKLASDYRKPDGLFVITPAMGPAFAAALPVDKFPGIGPATTAKMNRLGIRTGRDLETQTLAVLRRQFGKAGISHYWMARGIDERPVKADRARKSIGTETTFAHDLFDFDAMRTVLQPLIGKLWIRCESAGVCGCTVTLKVKYADFRQITRRRSLPRPAAGRSEIERVSLDLLASLMPVPKGVRLLGVTLSSLVTDTAASEPQLSFPL